VAEALARHILDRTDEDDPIAVFALLLSTFPDVPETLAVCRTELHAPRNPELTAMAQRHLATRPNP
jgi:hypothetical protein